MPAPDDIRKLTETIPRKALANLLGISLRALQYMLLPSDRDDHREPRPATLRSAGERLEAFGKHTAGIGRSLKREADRREKEGPTNGRRRRSTKRP